MAASTAVAYRIPAGWYRDKDDPSRRRWWDGIEWTVHYAPVTDPLTLVESTDPRMDPRMPALLASIGSQADRAIAPQPPRDGIDGTGSTARSDWSEQVEHAMHSSGTAISAMTATTTPARHRVPLTVIVLLAALTGANTVLLGILASGR